MTMNQRVEYHKIEEVADRLTEFENEGTARYFSLYYVNGSHDQPQPIGTDRQTGVKKFRQQVNDILNSGNADKIIVQEFSQRSRNVKEPAHTVEILIDRSYHAVPQPFLAQKQGTKEPKAPEHALKGLDPEEVFSKLESMKQDIRSEIAAEYQLNKEQDERKRIVEENERLKKENGELKESNTKLLDNNDELFEEVKHLQKFVPDNFKIGHLSVTRTLGSILGTAAETLAKNIVSKKPEKVRTLLGDAAFEQLAGFMEDEPDGPGQLEQPGPLEPLEPFSPEEEQKQQIAEAINGLNQRATPEEMGKIQCMYAFILNEGETIDPEKLNALLRFIVQQQQTKEQKPQKGDNCGTLELEETE